MQVTTAKLCCSDVFFWTFVRSPTMISCFNRTARRLIERSQLPSSCSVLRTMPKFIEPSVWPPISPDLNPVDYAVWGALQQSVYWIPISNLGDLKDRMRTCWESLEWPTDHQHVDWSVAWQTEGSIVRVNGGYIEQLFWKRYLLNLLSCSVVYRKFMRSKNVRTFCHCVSSVTVVLWRKVNLTNNHLIFQNKIDVILCKNNWRLIWHIIQHTALASSYWTTKNKGYGFYWPALYIGWRIWLPHSKIRMPVPTGSV